jgi:catechol 2,3-dioxygenase-like lactoylglutathione lyase family enzyme
MLRFHVNITVKDLETSISFYEALFGERATTVKNDYAKWMLEDPRVNFSISESKGLRGINHIGLQADGLDELEQIQTRLDLAEEATFKQPDAECCYARSTKSWVRDPDDVAWETFVTHTQLTEYGDDHVPQDAADIADLADKPETRCCA